MVRVFRTPLLTAGLTYERRKLQATQREKSAEGNSTPWRVLLVGAGNIAETHASVLTSFRDAQIVAVLEPDQDRAQRFARRWDIPNVLSGIDELSGSPPIADVAHVLVPPQLHMPVASHLLRLGFHVFIEKPMAQSLEECASIKQAAETGSSLFAVNHNFRYHPAHRRAIGYLQQVKFGRVRHVSMIYNMPLRQLTAGQLGHWMFDNARNLLLEQAVHPLSLLDDFIGAGEIASFFPGKGETFGTRDLVRTFLIGLQSPGATAQLHFALGESYPIWRALVICDDGAISVDYLANRVGLEETRPWLPPFSDLRNGIARARSLVIQDLNNSTKYALSTLRLIRRSDTFFVSMSQSIRTFYDGLGEPTSERAPTSGRANEQASRLVAMCSDLGSRVASKETALTAQVPLGDRATQWDVVVIGGTGFIGQHVVAALLREGKRVAVMARNIKRLPSLFMHPNVGLLAGNATEYSDVRAAIGDAEVVIHLAHGGGSGSSDVHDKLLGAARVVAEACLDAKVKRLIFVSSIAALYLGDARSIITGQTAPDLRAQSRAPYSRAKAEAERLLLAMQRERSLPVCILRPGLVVGEGGTAFHGGVGMFPNERHCLGWNRGVNPLPFVLATDVADAIVQSVAAPNLSGKTLNLVGDARLTAHEYVQELARVLGRPLQYHAQPVYKLFLVEFAKHIIKLIIGRREPRPTLYDFRSRGLLATFDCSDTIGLLGWHPVSDRAQLLRAGIGVHAHQN